jgi:phage gpG-like protein
MGSAAYADLTALAQDLAYASGVGIAKATEKVIKDAAQNIQSEAQTRAPIKSGALRNSISIRYPDPYSAIIGPDVEYGVYQEFGTGLRGEFPGAPYEIKPRNPGGVLAFKIGNRTVFAKKVTHPGVRARAYMRGALEDYLGDRLVTKMAEAGSLVIIKGPNA